MIISNATSVTAATAITTTTTSSAPQRKAHLFLQHHQELRESSFLLRLQPRVELWPFKPGKFLALEEEEQVCGVDDELSFR